MSALLDELRAAVARYQKEEEDRNKGDLRDAARIVNLRMAIAGVHTAMRNYAVEGKLTREGIDLVADLGDGTEVVLSHHPRKPPRVFRASAKAWLISRGASTGLDRLAEEVLRAVIAGDEMPKHMFGAFRTAVEIRKAVQGL